jgi:hypothetical protein
VKIWKVILATVVIFAAGMFAGVVAGRKTKALPPPPIESIPQISAQQRLYAHLKKELQLTTDQSNRIDKIFAEGNERVKLIWDLLNPELRKERQEVYDNVRAALTPEQREKFEKLVKERPPMRKPEFDGQRPRSQKPGTNAGAKGPRPEDALKSEAPTK